MAQYVSPFLLNGHAMPAADHEPHAQVGVHLRVNHHPLFGLPVAPFLIWRAEVKSRKQLRKRRAVHFRYEDGQSLEAPFVVTPDRPVIARIGVKSGETCIWAELNARPLDSPSRPLEPVVPVNPGRLFRGRDRIFGGLPDLDIRRSDLRRIPGLERPTDILIPNQSSGLTVEAHLDTPLGPAPIGSRSEPNYAFTGPGLIELRITGSGAVSGLDWAEKNDKIGLEWRRFAALNLPTETGPRYLSLTNPEQIASARVQSQAPKRWPLQDTTTLPTPDAAPLFSPSLEEDRVQSLLPFASEDLDALVNDPTPPMLQVLVDTVRDENDVEVGTSQISRLHRIYQGLADPGTASYLGYKIHDPELVETEDRVIFYHITGFFRDENRNVSPDDPDADPNILAFKLRLNTISPEAKTVTDGQIIERVSNTVGPLDNVEIGPGTLMPRNDYIELSTIAAADIFAPLDPVKPPVLTNTTHKSWLPKTPPDSAREVQVDVEGVRVTGLLAASKRTPGIGPGNVEALNKENDNGWHLPLVLSLNAENAEGATFINPGEGFIADRNADADTVRYFLAQQDRFGRYSNWANRLADPGPRPKPPRPHIQAFYSQPSLADAPTKRGKILVKIPVPDPESLAPGSHLLKELELTRVDDPSGSPETSVWTVAEATKSALPGDPGTFFLNISLTGPDLARAESRKIRFTAKWRDVTDVMSVASEAVTLTATDPRPPLQLVVPDALQYAARPDVMGLSWVEHRWNASSGQSNFAIYYADETRLRGWLTMKGENVLLTALDNAEHAAERATIFRGIRDKFPDHLFERLKDVNVDFASGEVGFRHPLSGSLRALSFYLIAAEAESGAKPVLTDLDFIVYGIPNSDPPQRPILEVSPTTPIGDENEMVAEIGIKLLAGATLGETWRLRRSSFESGTVAKMPVVKSGSLGDIDDTTGFQVATARDDGPVVIADHARLQPWKQYTWVAEIQGAAENGSVAAGRPVAGRWSRASDPVSMVIVPETAPAAIDPTMIDLDGTILITGLGNAQLRFTYERDLASGPLGAFTLRIAYRTAAGEPLTVLSEINIADYRDEPQPGDPPDSFAYKIDGDPLATDTGVLAHDGALVLELIDPIGRTAPATERDI